MLAEHAVDGGAGDTIAPGELAEALATLAVPQDGSAIEFEWFASDVPALEPGAAHAGAHPLDDQIAFQFGNRSDDDDDGPPQRTTGVDLLAEADELDVDSVQLIEHFEEVFHRAGDPIRSPDQQDIEAAAAGIAHHLIEPGPPYAGAAHPICILLDDLIAALLSHLAQVIELCFWMLIESGDTQVQGGALHGECEETQSA